MLKLCGVRLSNYYNKVKIALIEKGIPFEEEYCTISQDPAMLARSPLGKVPFLDLGNGQTLCESQVIIEYLEDAYPERPLLPKDPLARARTRELLAVMEINFELVGRRLFWAAFFGGPSPSDETKKEVRRELKKGLRAIRQLASFSPYAAGQEFGWADCAAVNHLPLVGAAVQKIFNEDVYGDYAETINTYQEMIRERAAVKRTLEDRKDFLKARDAGLEK
jgi:glutathione S-transferase